MTSPILALRGAILARAGADAALAALMGGRVALHDEPPRAAEPVYALFGPAEARDASVDLGAGHELDMTLVVWGKPGSARTALEVGERLAALLHDADAPALPLVGHRLINLRVAKVEVGRDAKADLARVVLRLRAVTERA